MNMEIKKIVVYLLLCSMGFLQEWDERTLICGPKKERKVMCKETKQFLENYWVNHDYKTVIEMAYNLILCDCIDDDECERAIVVNDGEMLNYCLSPAELQCLTYAQC